MAGNSSYLLALDVGERRIGVARASADVGIASPLMTLEQSDTVMQAIQKLVEENDADVLVVGLPRGLDGQETDQTRSVRRFVDQLKAKLDVPVAWQDEALTSHKAETELAARGKSFDKAEVDALAATYILEDYIADNSRKELHV